jgi:CheY-like chemotaxis protein
MPKKKILIAEDNRDGAETLQRVVEAWGHEAQALPDGRQAVEFACDFKPDVAILDINMPVMDGYAAARLLRIAHEQLMLIAMTGAPQVETRRRAREAGFHHHFGKPVDLAELRDLLDCDPPQHLDPGFRFRD